MPSIGDTTCMNEKLNIWAMWDGVFWTKIHQTADQESWIMSKESFKRMLETHARQLQVQVHWGVDYES